MTKHIVVQRRLHRFIQIISCYSRKYAESLTRHSWFEPITPAVGWGSPLHAWLASVNWIGTARYLNRGYRSGARGMHYHILLRQYSQNYYTYNSVVKNIYSPCHKDACVQISIGNTEWLLRYKGVS